MLIITAGGNGRMIYRPQSDGNLVIGCGPVSAAPCTARARWPAGPGQAGPAAAPRPPARPAPLINWPSPPAAGPLPAPADQKKRRRLTVIALMMSVVAAADGCTRPLPDCVPAPTGRTAPSLPPGARRQRS